MKWFTADWHFFHDGVLEMCNRNFSCIADHDEHLLEQINKHVQPHDTLYVLGDLAWGNPDKMLERIKCKDRHLVWGNHDKNSYGRLFKSTQDKLIVKTRTLASATPAEFHEPMLQEFLKWRGQRSEQIVLTHCAHAYWEGSHHGWYNLYGHTHSQREEYLDNIWPDRRSMDCGMDNAKRLLGEYRPFSEDDVLAILGPRKGHDPVEFYIQKQKAGRQ